MAPKGNKRPTAQKKKAPQPSSNARSTPRSRSRPQQRQQNPTRSRSARNRFCNWYPVTEGTINGDTTPGALEELWLHPSNFPNTPFGASCSNHTHRTEHGWDIRIYITTAATTGARFAVVALSDPSYTGGMTAQTAWALVCNGAGSLMDTSGRGSTARITVRGSTTRLSNTLPPDGSSWLGFASACLCIYLLQPPVGITSSTQLTYTVMARTSWTPHNPLPGYLNMGTMNPINPAPPPQPTPGQAVDWLLNIQNAASSPVTLDQQPLPAALVLSHTGDSWLAGGYYMQFPSPGAQSPTTNDNTSGLNLQIQFRGTANRLTTGRVYTCGNMVTNWCTNWATLGNPVYFVIYRGVVSGTYCLIGFASYEPARRMADGDTGAVPSGTQLALNYMRPPVYSNILGHQISINQSTGQAILPMTTVYTTSRTSAIHQPYTTLSLSSAGVQPLSLDTTDAPNSQPPVLGQTHYASPLSLTSQPYQQSWGQSPTNSRVWLRRSRNSSLLVPTPSLPCIQPTPTWQSLQQSRGPTLPLASLQPELTNFSQGRLPSEHSSGASTPTSESEEEDQDQGLQPFPPHNDSTPSQQVNSQLTLDLVELTQRLAQLTELLQPLTPPLPQTTAAPCPSQGGCSNSSTTSTSPRPSDELD